MKRALSFLLVVILILGVLLLTSCAREGIFVFQLNDEGDGYVISALIKDPVFVWDGRIIPSTYNGLPVTEIKSGGFAGWKNLVDIVIPGSVEMIGSYAFGSSGLVMASIEEGTKTIGDYAFAYTYLSEIYLPSTIEYIGTGAFSFCYELNNIYFGGTMAEWNAITKADLWDQGMGVYDVVAVSCSDGTITFYTN